MSSQAYFRNLSPAVMEARCQGRMLDRRVEQVTYFLRQQHLSSGSKVLEIGAGTGQTMAMVSKSFPDVSFHGIDVVAEYIQYARQRYSSRHSLLHYDKDFVETLKLPAASVDSIYSVNVWHHVSLAQLDTAVQNVARVLKPHGKCLFIEPNWRHPYIFSYQALTKEERNFFPGRELKAIEREFVIDDVQFLYFFPESFRRVSETMDKLERKLERYALLAGSVVYTLSKKIKHGAIHQLLLYVSPLLILV